MTTFVFLNIRNKITALLVAAVCLGSVVAQATMSDSEFFGRLNLDYQGLEKVKAAVDGGDLQEAKRELGVYYRTRKGSFHPEQDKLALQDNRRSRKAVESLVNRTGDFDAALWSAGNVFDWGKSGIRFKERMYFLDTFGRAATGQNAEAVTAGLLGLIESFITQYPRPEGKAGGMWATMNTGIRLRSGWPLAFMGLLQTGQFDDERLVAFLKSVWEQTDHMMENRSETSNWLTFEMAGLYTSGIVYPEFADAPTWRKVAAQEALADMERGWLPDGVTIELSPAYGSFFSNYLMIYDLSSAVGRLDESGLEALLPLTENAYAAYLGMMTPERLAPATNDNGPAKVLDILKRGLERFPEREDFRWVLTEGEQGQAPDFTSHIFPYAGFAALRSGWQRDANMLYFDFGPVGYRHAHQDKLSVMLWAYGRPIMAERGLTLYDSDNPYVRYAMDTFSHNTAVVDNRPQRRNWYQSPHPRQAPYQKLADSRQWRRDLGEGHSQWFVSGVYDAAYGKAGASNSYPYAKGSDFKDGWGQPASHSRRVLFAEPDIYVVADTFAAKDNKSHRYDVRWHLDSTKTQTQDGGLTVVSADAGQPNLQIVPLRTEGLRVEQVSAQTKPELMGWQVFNGEDIRPATTVRHLKKGAGQVSLLTLLLPLKAGQSHLFKSVQPIAEEVFLIELNDGRRYELHAPANAEADMQLKPLPSK